MKRALLAFTLLLVPGMAQAAGPELYACTHDGEKFAFELNKATNATRIQIDGKWYADKGNRMEKQSVYWVFANVPGKGRKEYAVASWFNSDKFHCDPMNAAAKKAHACEWGHAKDGCSE